MAQNTEQQVNKAPVDLSSIDLDAVIRLIKPSGVPDGSRQILLPIYNTQVSVKAFPGSRGLSAEELDAALVDLRDTASTSR